MDRRKRFPETDDPLGDYWAAMGQNARNARQRGRIKLKQSARERRATPRGIRDIGGNGPPDRAASWMDVLRQ